jgi:lysophospholipase L1-like esterase
MRPTKALIARVTVLGICLVVALRASAQGTQAQKLQKADFVAICGDSITEQKMYSVYIQDYLLMCKPAGVDADLRAMQFGWSGEVSWGFLQKMPKEALRFPMTVATTCYGMNDGGYAPLSPDREKRYREAMTGIVKAFKGHGVRFIVVGSPGCVDPDTFLRPDPTDPEKKRKIKQAEMYNKTLGQLRDIAREVAHQNGCAFANVHDAMLDATRGGKAKYGEKYFVGGPDGFHPRENGQLVMAYAFLKALGCDGNIGTITIDGAGGKLDATEGHKVLSHVDGGVEVESTRYPFCFYGDPKSPAATSGVIDFIPFNQDLNRFMLVVKGSETPRMRITWGKNAKEFTKEQAEKGINLAAEFPTDNPFSESFQKVQTLIRKQQEAETPLVKKTLHDLATKKDIDKEAGEKKAAEEMANAKALFDAAAQAARAPVKHVIKIEFVK